jgi:ABC-type dipeptide/oligopeptide/nickel transport system permease subunit
VYAKFNQPLASFTHTTTIEGAALIVGSLAWAGPKRAIRAQTLSLRERAALRWSFKAQ